MTFSLFLFTRRRRIPLHTPRRQKSELSHHISHLQRCSDSGNFRKASEIHCRLITTGLHSSPFSLTSLISLYSRFSVPSLSLSIFFSSFSVHFPPNLIVFNAALSSLSANSLPLDALNFFNLLRFYHRPDEFSFPCAIKSSADLQLSNNYLPYLQSLHVDAFKAGLCCDAFIASALVHAYLRFSLVEDAKVVFDSMKRENVDVVLWNSMVIGLAKIEKFGSAVEYFELLLADGVSPSRFTVTGILTVFAATFDLKNGKKIHAFVIKMGFDCVTAVANALIDLYGKCGSPEDAELVFEMVVEKDDFSWNSMLSALECSGDHAGALKMFARMWREGGVQPDAVTLAVVLPACSQVAALRHGCEIHAYMIRCGIRSTGEGDVFVDNALVDMYAKCGEVWDARALFDRMPLRDSASWNIMIDGYAAHGHAVEALALFCRMQDEAVVQPDAVTLLAALSACNHSGMVKEGKILMKRIINGDFDLLPEPEHYACTVDMLGRAGLLDDAKEIAENSGVIEAWRAYLAACQARGDTVRTVEAAAKVVTMQPGESGVWVLLANAYGSAGRFREVAEVRHEMRQHNVRKTPGCSWVELPSGLHAFFTGDRTHSQCDEIHKMLLHVLIGMTEGVDGAVV